MSSLTGMIEWNLGPSFVMGRHSPLVTFHCYFTCNPTDAWVVPETDPGGLLASPRWRFYGLGRGLGSNEKVEMTLSARLGEGRMGLIYVFSPGSIVAHVE